MTGREMVIDILMRTINGRGEAPVLVHANKPRAGILSRLLPDVRERAVAVTNASFYRARMNLFGRVTLVRVPRAAV